MGNPVVGERIKQRRKQLGLTLDNIAQEIGVARSTIQRYEKGTIDIIKLPVIEAIARILSVNPAWICGKTDIMEPEKPSIPEAERPISDGDIKFALFGTREIDDDVLDRVKQFAKFAQEHEKNRQYLSYNGREPD